MTARQERYLKNFDYMMSVLARSHCIECGERDVVVLDFDHRDPEDKSFGIATNLWCASLVELKREIAKCDVRCSNCHRRRTAKQINSIRYVWTQSHPFYLVEKVSSIN